MLNNSTFRYADRKVKPPSLGQIAYEAAREYLISQRRKTWRPWNQMTDIGRKAFEAAEEAVILELDRPIEVKTTPEFDELTLPPELLARKRKLRPHMTPTPSASTTTDRKSNRVRSNPH